MRSGRPDMRRLMPVTSLDRHSEFGEGVREAQVWRGVGGEFVVAAAKVLHERVPSGDSCGRAEAFESAHRPQPSFQPAVIGLDPVVAVLLGDMRRSWDQFVQHPQVRAGLVGRHLDRRRTVPQRTDEESPCGGGVPLLGQQHVNDLPVLIHSPVQVPSPAGDLDVGLIHEPPVPGSVPQRPGGIGEQRGGGPAMH